MALQHIYQSRDPALYQSLINTFETSNAGKDGMFKASDYVQLDPKWAQEMSVKNQAERAKLEVELKNYTNNMIKESIRVSVAIVLAPWCR
jgi:COP9 signalosome complex subunit 1